MTNKLVLCADDDEDILSLVALRLERAGFDVVTAVDGEEAVRLARERHPALVVLDVMMPKQTGYEVLAALRAEPSLGDVKVILLSARVQESESDAYFASRPLGARLSAVASPQSRPVESREWLERRVAELGEQGEPARPEWWGGYRLAADAWEFWQHGDDRLHDRFRYRREGEGWAIERLGP